VVTTTPLIENVQVLHRMGQWCPGRRIGEVVAYDVRMLPPESIAALEPLPCFLE
jgi:hypothetical protein